MDASIQMSGLYFSPKGFYRLWVSLREGLDLHSTDSTGADPMKNSRKRQELQSTEGEQRPSSEPLGAPHSAPTI